MKLPDSAGPCATFGSPFASSATLMLLKTEKLARSAAGSAATAFEIAKTTTKRKEKKRMVFWTATNTFASNWRDARCGVPIVQGRDSARPSIGFVFQEPTSIP